MKKKILILIPIILILAIATRLIFVYNQQKEEFDFHKNIPKTIILCSDDFVQNGVIPIEFTGKGKNISPSLRWSNLPVGTRSLALLVTDYDAPAPYLKLNTIDHWVVYNINPQINNFQKGTNANLLKNMNVSVGENISGGKEYIGPKPPLGTHSYYFRIYALSTSNLNLTKPDKKVLIKAMAGSVLAYGELVGSY